VSPVVKEMDNAVSLLSLRVQSTKYTTHLAKAPKAVDYVRLAINDDN